MARFILLAVEDNDVAEEFVQTHQKMDGLEVVGLFGKPVNFCMCPDGYTITARVKTGGKFGWSVCPICHKARFMSQQAKNLLNDQWPWYKYFLSFRPTSYVKKIEEVWKGHGQVATNRNRR